jgi:hypothetical protein
MYYIVYAKPSDDQAIVDFHFSDNTVQDADEDEV